VLDRHGLVKRRRRHRPGATGTALSRPAEPNALWCADYKGEFMLGDHRYCYPLTITDFASRYLLTCEALSTTQEKFAFTVFERTFKEFGLPQAIRTDNGVPFASGHALYGLSKLAVWWLRLGIEIERTKPGHPEQNGRHERMHLTLKKEATKPAAANVFQQQARFDAFIDQFNRERPHQALGMKVPADVYARSTRVYRGLDELTYPFHDATFTVTQCGRICFKSRKVNLSHVFAGQSVGVTQVGERVWLVTFMRYDLGYFDDETCRLEPIDNGVKLVAGCAECGGAKELHGFWDGVVGETNRATVAASFAETLAAADATAAAVTDVDRWTSDSFDLARPKTYVNPPIGITAGPFDITPGYRTDALAVAKTQIALAGARLANLINANLR
jgi:putative transposase